MDFILRICMCMCIYYMGTIRVQSYAHNAIYVGPFAEIGPISKISKLGLKGDKLVDQIRINGECYGESNETDGDLCSKKGEIQGNLITLAQDEYFNSIEYQYHNRLTYISFCTNKGKCVEGGNRTDKSIYDWLPFSTDWGYGMLQNIEVYGIGSVVSELNGTAIKKLYVEYRYVEGTSQLKEKAVSIILDYTPPSKVMFQYDDQDFKKAEVYTKAYNKYAYPQKEIMAKIGDNFAIIENGTKIMPRSMKTKPVPNKTYQILEGYVGVKLGVGELWEGDMWDWLFPTSVTSHRIINTSDITKVFGHYDLTNDAYDSTGLEAIMPNLTKYKNKHRGVVYFSDRPAQQWRTNRTFIGTIGNNSKNEFVSAYFISKLGLSSDFYVNQIRVNSFILGKGGIDRGSIVLDQDEYINKVEYYSTDTNDTSLINYISFYTSKNKCISGGTKSTNGNYGKLENIRLLRIFYNNGLRLVHVSDHLPLELVAKKVNFILEVTPAFKEMIVYKNSELKFFEVHIKAFENAKKINLVDYMPNEVIFKVAQTFGIYISKDNEDHFLTFNDYQHILEWAQKNNLTTRKEIPPDKVGVKLAIGELWKGANGKYWLFPRTLPRILVVKPSEIFKFLDCYDLTGKLHTQIHNLKKYIKIRNGFVHYARPNRSELFYNMDESLVRTLHCFLFVLIIIFSTVIVYY